MQPVEKITKLESIIPSLPPHNQTFANDLINGKWGFKKTGKLSEKQWFFVDKFIKQAEVTPPASNPATSGSRPMKLGNVQPILDLFDKALASKLKKPALALKCAGQTLKVFKTLGGAKPGTIAVYNKDTGFYVGRAYPDGRWEPSYALKGDLETAVPALLIKLALNPVGVTAALGKKEGQCCFCARPLTDDTTGASIDRGYGPVCAKKWGLPWG